MCFSLACYVRNSPASSERELRRIKLCVCFPVLKGEIKSLWKVWESGRWVNTTMQMDPKGEFQFYFDVCYFTDWIKQWLNYLKCIAWHTFFVVFKFPNLENGQSCGWFCSSYCVCVLCVIAHRTSCVLENSCHLPACQSPVPKVPWSWVPKYSQTRSTGYPLDKIIYVRPAPTTHSHTTTDRLFFPLLCK